MYAIRWQPNPGPQTAFLSTATREVLYGGAVGGGKSDALVALPLHWATHPAHRAIIFRRERRNAQELVDRMRSLYSDLFGADYWHETEMRFKLPSGAFIYVAYAELEKDIEKWKSFEFNLIEFDELSEFTQHQYTFMLSRNRSKSPDLPLMMRAATNPGGEGMAWVMDYFDVKNPWKLQTHRLEVEGLNRTLTITRQFIPSTVFDNPKLPNRDAYLAGLAAIPDEAMREAMMYGRWDRFTGQYFLKNPKYCEPGIKKEEYGEWYVIRCMDYGWTDPSCVLWLVVYPEANRLEVAAELYGKHMTTDSLAHLVKAIEKENGFEEKVRYSVLSPDAEKPGREGAQSISSLLGQAGVWFQRANNDRVSGWAQILRLIENDQLFMWMGKAPNLERTLIRLPRDPNKPNDVKNRGVEDHAAEALRYGCMAYYNPPDALVTPAIPASPNRYRDTMFDQVMAEIMKGGKQGAYVQGLGAGW